MPLYKRAASTLPCFPELQQRRFYLILIRGSLLQLIE